ncbi:pimeloyl-ACP methyl ester carboxylesterase [Spirosoma oryzae]|uniref:Pimeloyl-ACP methyl ester carboxylesterase n=1 Tax=Spirosoma oryzae TaxID=1469603 RepID=A0A2T0SMQ2_9BACT|nr:alpha/beta hydrolase [Spirosoma oryzae]PRY34675.1 pimeloyl-ACP methyl ester carboxylesterase [Spirosoma oryzae]
MTHTTVDTNGVRLHVVQAGPETGPLVLLLHGFPEFWYGWTAQIDGLAEAGYRVWAPDQRGYNLSDKPDGIDAYQLDTLVADVVGLIDAAGQEKAIIVGHDWGGIVSWWLAVSHPERVERLVILNVPHPAVTRKFIRQYPGQLLRSWYIAFFQLPILPEWIMGANRSAMLARTLRTSSRSGTFSPNDLAQYRTAWSQPGSVRSMINWYRALIRRPPARRPSVRVTMPALIIWGIHDQFLKQELAQASLRLCDDGRVEYLDTTHWVQHEAPQRVNELIQGFTAYTLSRPSSRM